MINSSSSPDDAITWEPNINSENYLENQEDPSNFNNNIIESEQEDNTTTNNNNNIFNQPPGDDFVTNCIGPYFGQAGSDYSITAIARKIFVEKVRPYFDLLELDITTKGPYCTFDYALASGAIKLDQFLQEAQFIEDKVREIREKKIQIENRSENVQNNNNNNKTTKNLFLTLDEEKFFAAATRHEDDENIGLFGPASNRYKHLRSSKEKMNRLISMVQNKKPYYQNHLDEAGKGMQALMVLFGNNQLCAAIDRLNAERHQEDYENTPDAASHSHTNNSNSYSNNSFNNNDNSMMSMNNNNNMMMMRNNNNEQHHRDVTTNLFGHDDKQIVQQNSNNINNTLRNSQHRLSSIAIMYNAVSGFGCYCVGNYTITSGRSCSCKDFQMHVLNSSNNSNKQQQIVGEASSTIMCKHLLALHLAFGFLVPTLPPPPPCHNESLLEISTTSNNNNKTPEKATKLLVNFLSDFTCSLNLNVVHQTITQNISSNNNESHIKTPGVDVIKEAIDNQMRREKPKEQVHNDDNNNNNNEDDYDDDDDYNNNNNHRSKNNQNHQQQQNNDNNKNTTAAASKVIKKEDFVCVADDDTFLQAIHKKEGYGKEAVEKRRQEKEENRQRMMMMNGYGGTSRTYTNTGQRNNFDQEGGDIFDDEYYDDEGTRVSQDAASQNGKNNNQNGEGHHDQNTSHNNKNNTNQNRSNITNNNDNDEDDEEDEGDLFQAPANRLDQMRDLITQHTMSQYHKNNNNNTNTAAAENSEDIALNQQGQPEPSAPSSSLATTSQNNNDSDDDETKAKKSENWPCRKDYQRYRDAGGAFFTHFFKLCNYLLFVPGFTPELDYLYQYPYIYPTSIKQIRLLSAQQHPTEERKEILFPASNSDNHKNNNNNNNNNNRHQQGNSNNNSYYYNNNKYHQNSVKKHQQTAATHPHYSKRNNLGLFCLPDDTAAAAFQRDRVIFFSGSVVWINASETEIVEKLMKPIDDDVKEQILKIEKKDMTMMMPSSTSTTTDKKSGATTTRWGLGRGR